MRCEPVDVDKLAITSAYVRLRTVGAVELELRWTDNNTNDERLEKHLLRVAAQREREKTRVDSRLYNDDSDSLQLQT